MNGVPESHYQPVLEIRYSARYCLRMRRFYGRIAAALGIAEIVGGSAAVAGFASEYGALSAVAGLIMAIMAAINIIIAPTEKRMLCEAQRRRWADLDSIAGALDLAELRRRIHQLYIEEVPDIESLRDAAMNDAMRENGRMDAIVPLTIWQRAMVAMA